MRARLHGRPVRGHNHPLTVALLAITLLGVVFAGVALVLRSRELDQKPGRHPVTPPSIDDA